MSARKRPRLLLLNGCRRRYDDFRSASSVVVRGQFQRSVRRELRDVWLLRRQLRRQLRHLVRAVRAVRMLLRLWRVRRESVRLAGGVVIGRRAAVGQLLVRRWLVTSSRRRRHSGAVDVYVADRVCTLCPFPSEQPAARAGENRDGDPPDGAADDRPYIGGRGGGGRGGGRILFVWYGLRFRGSGRLGRGCRRAVLG
ncbi:hypothetical protein L209DRAFT_151100 [Thermothelomyces heterothallicus CBS 203.75]